MEETCRKKGAQQHVIGAWQTGLEYNYRAKNWVRDFEKNLDHATNK